MPRRRMSLPQFLARYGYVPLMLIGINGCAVICAGHGLRLWQVALLLVLAIGLARLAEHILPYEAEWNRSHGDIRKDVTHSLVYELSGLAGLLWLQLVAWAVPWQGIWPREWPRGLQLLAAIVVTDIAVTLLHYASHHVAWLWKLHCVHHGVHRLYGFNGMVRHPLHQQLDLAVGVLPLVLLGMPFALTVVLGLAMSVQLILQHSNVDYCVGPFRYVLAIGPSHRLHHVSWKGEGDVNFGLFFTAWDRLLGTFRVSSQRAPAAGDIGLQDESCFPQRYWAQLALPFALGADMPRRSTQATAAVFRGDARVSLERPATTRSSRINCSYATGVGLVHLLALLALVPWLFSWTGVALVFIGNYVFCSLGIGAGYHRCLAHRSFCCSKRFERLLAILGVCTLQDSPTRWVAVHRKHHRHADHEADPHSPLATLLWGHIGWLFIVNSEFEQVMGYERYTRDLLRDPFYRALQRNALWWFVYVGHAAAMFMLGFLLAWGWTADAMSAMQFGASVLVWGVLVRTVYSWHITWGVNSVAHMWGYRNHETGENSRNNWLIALSTNGEGWHNNHHAHPRRAAHGFQHWWEIDVTYLTILLWERLGLVWNVTRHSNSAPSTPHAHPNCACFMSTKEELIGLRQCSRRHAVARSSPRRPLIGAVGVQTEHRPIR
jgi:fatty-acid desaturase/sterol desaturase/sphingolipid hydroxylase (fatty acid hydroxylase superfamily)